MSVAILGFHMRGVGEGKVLLAANGSRPEVLPTSSYVAWDVLCSYAACHASSAEAEETCSRGAATPTRLW